MSYTIKEIYYTIQGEGMNTGRAAVFCRFTGCNLWSGHESDRSSAICRFCDTDFVGTDGPGGGKYAGAADVAKRARALWPREGQSRPLLVCTGGEPLLQMDPEFVRALHETGFEIAIETNGTRLPPEGIEWICVSPKGDAPLAITRGDELKLVVPQEGMDPANFLALDFRHFLLQPMDGPFLRENTRFAIDYCLAHPQWRLSVQTHKFLGIP